MVQVEWWDAHGSGFGEPARLPQDSRVGHSSIYGTQRERDFTFTVEVTDLRPDTDYRYRIRTASLQSASRFDEEAKPSVVGAFRTAPPPTQHATVTFVWSGDLGGQGRCRQGDPPYPVLERARELRPAFMLLLGDLIYGDESCPSPPNVAGSEMPARSLEEYRAKHRYQRGAQTLHRLLAQVPVWAIWDDHEVRNNFSGPFDPQMPAGRQALLDYWPIGTLSEDPTRLYRSVRYGADLELFILDTRQYRSRNQDLDGPDKTMLGPAQLAWLLEGVTSSTATWKVIATSVPLSHPAKGSRDIPGNDGWARGEDGTGFETELSRILQAFRARGVHNLVWLGGDVHYVQGTAFDPDGDGKPDFHEFIAGPLSAKHGRVVPVSPTFRPTLLFSDSGYDNIGVVTVGRDAFRVEIVDVEGRVRHRQTLSASQPVAR